MERTITISEEIYAARYYADYPDEIDRVLAESEPEAIKARLYRSLGPTGYRRLTGETEVIISTFAP